ncbi:TRAP transporter small permease [Aliamphritea ceti]|uniref:TRAP transporter small permease n=1 Tax=Aliamphritea ceti TaxID=1524258 RepID=UPI0021C42E84|nr:TRAP transporter small permease [Aliamphritea ceti]
MSQVITGLLNRLDLWIGRIEASILSIAIIAMAVNSIANVFGRYLFNQSLYFSDELNQFLIVIVTFMGLGYITRKGKHIRMSAFYDMLPARWQKIFMVVIALLTATVMFVLAWYALEYVMKIARRGRVTPALQFPLYLTYIWVALGLLIGAIQYLLTAIKNLDLQDDTVYISYTTVDEYEDPEIADAIQRCQSNNTEGTNDVQSETETSKQHQVQESKS